MKQLITLLLIISSINIAQATIGVVSITPCTNNSCNGAIDIQATGTAAPFTFAWSNGATTEDLSNLCTGTYTVTVTNRIGCTRVLTATVAGNSDCLISSTTPSPACAGVGGGIGILMSIVPNATNYVAIWDNGLSSGGGTPQKVMYFATPGQHCANVAALNISGQVLCRSSSPICATIPDIAVSATATTTRACYNSPPNIGSIDLTPQGGYSGGTWTYNWSNNATTQDINNLAGGNYTVTLTAKNSTGQSCATTKVINVPTYSAISAGLVANSNTCVGTCMGEITANPTGGAGGGSTAYTYLWSVPADRWTNRADNPCLYACQTTFVTITDAVGCTTSSNMILGEKPLEPRVYNSANCEYFYDFCNLRPTTVQEQHSVITTIDAATCQYIYTCRNNQASPNSPGPVQTTLDYASEGTTYNITSLSDLNSSTEASWKCSQRVVCDLNSHIMSTQDGMGSIETYSGSGPLLSTTLCSTGRAFRTFKCNGVIIAAACAVPAILIPDITLDNDKKYQNSVGNTVYPNPFDNEIVINIEAQQTIDNTKGQIRLFNTLGQSFYIQKDILLDKATNLVIPTQNVPDGMYILEFSDGINTTQFKLLKLKE